jgi:hypothetical protein
MSHTATLMENGRVLLAGGQGSFAAYQSGEVYDPATASSRPTGQMNASRLFHAAAPLVAERFWYWAARIRTANKPAQRGHLTTQPPTRSPATGNLDLGGGTI